ncbi:hypothetical protein BV898_08284 [Hypsibius exemplaris]|uniref:Uncharacterized protein n=1 Tax=Hypsibius exemplaris TaxID=2072580 RepID=A0A1W0WR35_HYPEX|nr:hypothetical protein BV898_08284 [Hypsibius exemplaris]
MTAPLSTAAAVEALAPPPAHIVLPVPILLPQASVTSQIFLHLPLLTYQCRVREEIANRLKILHTVVPERLRTRLWLKRVSEAVDTVYHFSMEREEPIQPMFILAARKRLHCGLSYFDFWIEPLVYNLLQRHESFLGYSVSNPFGTGVSIYTGTPKLSDRDALRREVAAIMYKPELVAGKVRSWPSVMILVPGPLPTQAGNLTDYQPSKAREHLLSRWNHRREPASSLADILGLENSSPLCEPGQTLPSECVTNLEIFLKAAVWTPPPIVAPKFAPTPVEEDKTPVLVVTRENPATVIIDFTYPVTAFLAASITINLLDGKAASDFINCDSGRTFQHHLPDCAIGNLVSSAL